MDRFKVSEDDDGRRLDKVLRGLWPSLPLGAMMRAFRKKEVRVDGKRADFSMRLSFGQEVVVPWEPRSRRPGPENPHAGDLKTLYIDGSVWIIDKPAGLLSQPDSKGGDSVVTRAWVSGGFRPQALNRLDRNTSGVMALALTGKALRALSKLWRDGKVEKTYLALVVGNISKAGSLDFPLLKNPDTNVVEVKEGGKEALTLYRPLGSGVNCTLCQVEIPTGRSHQIRAHMAHIGHPVVGDGKYGGGDVKAKRPMLHASSLSFPWPEAEGGTLTVKSPVPDDMAKILETLSVVKYTHI